MNDDIYRAAREVVYCTTIEAHGRPGAGQVRLLREAIERYETEQTNAQGIEAGWRRPEPSDCPHGVPYGEDCDACDRASDYAYDVAQEQRAFGRY